MSTPPITQPSGSRWRLTYSREAVFLICIILLLIFSGVTAFAARMYHKRIHVLADDWFAQGETSFRAADAMAALADYRNALAFAPVNPKFQFHFAQALAATGHDVEARDYLETLLSESPGSGPVNLELARIAARKKDMAEALRYYHSAIYGEWDANPIQTRWEVRRELCEFLLQRNSIEQTEPEVIALADNTSAEDVPRQKVVGALLLRTETWIRALDVFESVLVQDHRDAEALSGAGTASFELGKYQQALNFFERLPAAQRNAAGVAEMLETSRQIAALDPFLHGLSPREKAARTLQSLDIAVNRLQVCAQAKGAPASAVPPATPMQHLFASSAAPRKEWSRRYLERNPDSVDAAMAFVFQSENLAVQECGPSSGNDHALWLLSRGGEGGSR
ncbi:MAG: tetratricopeptide repeat protein [Candidatus Acidiferrales bacterium]